MKKFQIKNKKLRVRIPIGPSTKIIESKKYKKEKHRNKCDNEEY